MKYPTLSELNTSHEMIDVFGGYNHNLRIGDGEFYEMTNLSSSHYPLISPRGRRGVYISQQGGQTTPENPVTMIAKDKFCYIAAKKDNPYGDFSFYINGKEVVNLTLNTDIPKRLISFGAYVIIMPDKLYINVENTDENGSIYAESKVTNPTFSLCKIDGSLYSENDDIPCGDEAPEEPNNLALWIDTSSIPHILKQYSSDTGRWISISTTYIKISATGIGKFFSDNDGIVISGLNSTMEVLNGIHVICARDDDYIVIKGFLDFKANLTSTITIKREMPDMDFLIESGNRLWGCKYGTTSDNKVVNEIYCSKLGDFKNWNVFAGISTDSYVASVGTEGPFTAAVTYGGHPIFFKENCLHKIYGDYPANFRIQIEFCRGVQNGCSKSLAIANEILYYKSRSGVCAYDGSLPTEISSALGDELYDNASAGAIGYKYYISMRDKKEKYHLFVYDSQHGIWHREDDTQASEFCSCDGELYYIDYAVKQIKSVNGSGMLDKKPVEWEAITGFIGTDITDKKYVSRIVVRLFLDVGATVHVYAEYDSIDSWELLFSMTGTKLKSFSIPIRPRRCDHLRLKIHGVGEAKIHSITKAIEQGSDI